VVKEKIVQAKRYIGKKDTANNHYEWEYYALNFSLYLDKDWVFEHGTKYKIKTDDKKGLIILEPIEGTEDDRVESD